MPRIKKVVDLPSRKRPYELPECPAVALRQDHGRYFFLSGAGEIREFTFSQLASPGGLISLFDGNLEYLRDRWPRTRASDDRHR